MRRILLGLAMLALSAGSARADELTLYLYPTQHGLDFSTPKSLAQSAVRNTLSGDPHSIGHLNVDLRCDATADQAAVHVLTGTTNANPDDPQDLLVREGYGLGILFTNFDGRLYTAQEIESELPGRIQSGELSFMTWKIQPSTCRRMAQYFNEYVARGYDHYYGLPNRPLYGEGAGCSAFGASFLEVGGLMEDAYLEGWRHYLRVPKRYVGGPLTGQHVRLLPLLISVRRTRWAEQNEAHFPILFWDPETMYNWVESVWSGESDAEPQLPYTRARMGNAVGLIVDATAVPTPTEPIWRD